MIVLLGGSGYVGQAIQEALSLAGHRCSVLSRKQLDYTNVDLLTAYLRDNRPEFLINAAGYTGRPNVDACELHKTECLTGNAVLPGVIRNACEAAKIPWGHVSSGCIFTGARPDGSGFTESDPPNFSFRQNNCSFYSGTKALGEELLEGAEQCYIWRLRIPFNEYESPRNYITKLLRYDCLLEATNSLSQLSEFAASCVACWTKKVPFGLYNLTNPGSVTTRDVVELIVRNGLSKKQFRFFDSEDQFMQLAAKTPRSNCVLDSSKAIAAGLPLSPIHDALEKSMKSWVPAPK
ncbi:MAG: sugar nucleotide-binding protein [Planctomyces sp.]|nr:sugar nucleotide-binding protein [Planctomyces sp.]